jgi:hypothetical protein
MQRLNAWTYSLMMRQIDALQPKKMSQSRRLVRNSDHDSSRIADERIRLRAEGGK